MRVLQFWVNADGSVGRLGERHEFVERGDLEAAVVRGVAVGPALVESQPPELLQREVEAEVVGDVDIVQRDVVRRFRSVDEHPLRVGDRAEPALVQTDQLQVFRDADVALDVVGALLDGEAVGGQRVLRQQAAAAAVTDHQRPPLVAGRHSRPNGLGSHHRHKHTQYKQETSSRMSPTTLPVHPSNHVDRPPSQPTVVFTYVRINSVEHTSIQPTVKGDLPVGLISDQTVNNGDYVLERWLR